MARLALAQINTTVGAFERNVERILVACEEAAAAGADLVLTPELAVSGYPPEDLLLRRAFLDAAMEATAEVARRTPIPCLVGAPWFETDTTNAALLCTGGGIAERYDKRELPNYGVFDEERVFAAGSRQLGIEVGDLKCAVTICEDIWLPAGPAERAARGGALCILNLSSSPYHVGKAAFRERMLGTRAADSIAFVAYCNLVGGQDDLVFDGASVVLSPEGDVIARAAAFEEEVLVCDVEAADAIGARLRDGRLRHARRSKPLALRASLPAAERDGPPQRPLAAPPPSREAEIWAALTLGLRDYVEKNGFERVLLGISGGIDSALTAALAADALGAARVEAISMPTRFNVEATQSDAERVAQNLGIAFRELPIEDLRLAFHRALPDMSGIAAENVQARIRGTLLMSVSNQHGHLLLTTSNKSETAVGYSTLYGDSAGGFAPLQDVPKTTVFALARHVNEVSGKELIPRSTIDRPPTAELRDNQKDQDSLPPYELLDPILEAYVEDDLSVDEMVARGIAERPVVERVARLVDRAEYKRRQAAPGIKLRPKAFGRDRRMPITNRFVP